MARGSEYFLSGLSAVCIVGNTDKAASVFIVFLVSQLFNVLSCIYMLVRLILC